MSFLSRIFPSARPAQPVPDHVVTRRVESERAKAAARKKADAERLVCLTKAATMGRVTMPMTPRARIAMEVQRDRLSRKLAGDIQP